MRRVPRVDMLDAADDAAAGNVGVGSQMHKEAPADETMLIRGVRHDTALFLGNSPEYMGMSAANT